MKNSICISINDATETDDYKVNISNVWKAGLSLDFDDISFDLQPYKLFSQEDARQILDACLDDQLNLKNYEHFVVHCGAGVSRSAAIAKFLHEIRDGASATQKKMNSLSLFNKHVFSTLVIEYDFLALERGLPCYLNKIDAKIPEYNLTANAI